MRGELGCETVSPDGGLVWVTVRGGGGGTRGVIQSVQIVG